MGLVTLAGCAGSVDMPDTETEALPSAYPEKGFIVHEWGTDTVVVGSDGSLQLGMHHEEEDLPAFVYDRLKAGALPGAPVVQGTGKMETPVTYFYSDVPRTVDVRVAFPSGVLTQWYPAVRDFYPPLVMKGGGLADPALDLDFHFTTQSCKDQYGKVGEGLLDWGDIEVLPRGTGTTLPEASLDHFTWSHAREVNANLVRISGAPGATEAEQHEKFLFYRGVGNIDLPVVVRTSPGGRVRATNVLNAPVGEVFVLHVGAERGAYVHFEQGISPGGVLAAQAPDLDAAEPLDAFVETLGEAVTGALDRTGLYHDEATAMVRTWKRQWFRTPGLRVLYLAPQSWTDASIPLSIEPKPDTTVRVMMIRVEVITPELETVDATVAGKISDPASQPDVAAYFTAMGRFAEPRMRRALQLAGHPAGSEAVLAEVASAKTVLSAGE